MCPEGGIWASKYVHMLGLWKCGISLEVDQIFNCMSGYEDLRMQNGNEETAFQMPKRPWKDRESIHEGGKLCFMSPLIFLPFACGINKLLARHFSFQRKVRRFRSLYTGCLRAIVVQCLHFSFLSYPH